MSIKEDVIFNRALGQIIASHDRNKARTKMEQHAEANEIPSVDKLTDFLQKISNFRALAIQYETEEEHEQEYNEESQNELVLH